MKKIASAYMICMVLASMLAGCSIINANTNGVRGSGKVVTQERPLSGVSQVELATLGDMTIQMGNEEKLVIEAEDNILPYLTSDVKDGKLVVASKSGVPLYTSHPIRYTLTLMALDGVATSSLGTIKAPEITTGSFKIDVSSGGDIGVASLIADQLNVSISSQGNVIVGGGQVNEQTIEISSSGDYTADKLASVQATANLSSNGNATIRVSDGLQGSLSSSGNLNYYGSPTVNVQTSSSGKVNQLGN